MELFELQAKIADLEQQIVGLPAGSVTKKTINGNAYACEEGVRRRGSYRKAQGTRPYGMDQTEQ